MPLTWSLGPELRVSAVRAGVSMSADLADDAARDLKDVGNMDSLEILSTVL